MSDWGPMGEVHSAFQRAGARADPGQRHEARLRAQHRGSIAAGRIQAGLEVETSAGFNLGPKQAL